MKTQKTLLISLLVVVVVIGMTGFKNNQQEEDLAGQLQATLDAAVASPDTNFPGAVLYVSSPEFGPWAGAAGLGDTETGTAATPNDKFRAGSLIKPFISVVILQLVEDGLISLDDPLTAVVPEATAAKFAGSEEITVRMLLNHTSGIADWVGPAFSEIVADPARVWTVEEITDIAAAAGPSFAPGEDYTYCNTEYNLLGLVIEQATGRSWREEIRERILGTLNLEDTVLPEPGDLSIPGSYLHGYATLEGEVLDATAWDPSMAGAAGGGALVTTSADLARFLDAVRTGELFQNGDSLGEMLAFVDVSTDPAEAYHTGYGLGVMKFELPGGAEMLGHFASTAGYFAFVYYLPAQDLTISGATNSMDSLLSQLLYPALEILVPGFAAAGQQRAQGGNVYEDPEGRFSMPLVGDWTQVETDGTYALFEVTGFDLNMYVVAVEADDPEAGVGAALRQIGIDPATLTQTKTDILGRWDIFFYSVEEEEGVTVLVQVKDGMAYCLIAAGDLYLTEFPPDHVMKTIEGFTLAGEEFVLPATIGEFEAYINSFVGDVPAGLSIAIALGNEILYVQGFGMADGPKGMAATPDTVYQWSSVTKIATASAIMQLYDQGLLDLDAPVSDYLDYFPAEYPITVRQLLTHSAALPDPPGFVPLNLSLDGQPLPDPDALARGYYEEFAGLMFEPGSASRYSNLDYMTLGQIVAEVSGQPYLEYLQEHFLGPLGMDSTDFTHSSEAMIANAAAGAFPAAGAEDLIVMVDEIRGLGDGADFIRETDDRHAWMNLFRVAASSGGGLLGPVTEAIRFGQMHLNGGELGGVRILSPESVTLMQEMQLSTSGAPLGYGLGWNIFDGGEHPYLEHNGDGTGSAAKLRLYPNEGLAIVMMSNSNGWDRATVADAAANVVFSMME